MKIKIISASNPEKWYADKIGSVFETYGDAFNYGHGGMVYFIENVQGFKFVRVEDVEIISEDPSETKRLDFLAWANSWKDFKNKR